MQVQAGDKLYVVVRRDVPPGLQLAQAVHGAFEAAVAEPERVTDWVGNSNYLVVLSAADEQALAALAGKLATNHVDFLQVREPDCNDQLMAVVVYPHPEARRMLSALPLALKEPAMTG